MQLEHVTQEHGAVKRRGEEAVALWRGMIERRAASGLSIWRFCQRAGVSTALFHAWKRKLRFQSKSAGGGEAAAPCPLVPVRVIADAGPPAIAVELPGGNVARDVSCGPPIQA